MPKFTAKFQPGPRKSNTSTPAPGEDGLTLAEKLNFADLPRPFKNPHFASRLHLRAATTSTTTVKKNVKQILVLERERLSGGDGFLTASQTAQKARGEPIDIGKKKNPGGGVGVNAPGRKKGNIANLKRGRLSGLGLVTGNGGASGTATPATAMEDDSVVDSGRTSPTGDDEGGGSGAGAGAAGQDPAASASETLFRRDLITYHTPTAPPSLLPAKKYCDITGLHASYTDPRTKLRYKGLEVWHVVRGLGPGGDQAYLALRNAQTSLK